MDYRRSGDMELIRLLESVESNDEDELKRMLQLEFEEVDLMKAFHLAAQLGHQASFFILLDEEHDRVKDFPSKQKTSLLITAIEYGHKDVVEQLITRCDVDVNQTGQYGLSPLHRAAWQGYADIANLLIAAGAYMAAKDLSGDTPLILAAQQGHQNTGHVLLTQGCDVNEPGQQKMTPLMLAAEKGWSGFVKLLLSFKADPDMKESWLGHTALTLGCEKGHVQAVTSLLASGADPTVVTIENMAAIHYASKGGHIGCVRVLLDYGVNPNVYNKHNSCPIIYAADAGHLEVLHLLISRGASDPVALHRAASKGHNDCVKLLLQYNYDPNHQDLSGNTPLVLAARMGHLSTVQILEEVGADVRYRNDLPLLESIINGQAEVAEFFLKKGANPKSASDDGVLPIFWAAMGDHCECIRLLIQYGASPNSASLYQNVTPLSIAISKNYFNSVRVLKECNADINLVCASDVTMSPLEQAVKHGFLKIVALLVMSHCDMTFIRDVLNSKKMPNSLKDKPQFWIWLREESEIVPKLKVVCRRFILSCVGGCMKEKTDLLPLPVVLRNYLIPPCWED